MKKFLFTVVTVVAAIVCTLSASAQITNYVTGEFNGWNAAGNVMTETSPGSGIWQVSLTLTNTGRYEFKITTGTWATNWPTSGGNSWLYTDISSNVTVTFDTNIYADGYLSPSNRIGVSVDPGTWTAVGDWQSQVSPGNWNNAEPLTAMTSVGGGIYKFQATLVQGTYQYKAVKTGSWDAIGSDFRSINANTLVFTNASGGSAVFDFFVNAVVGDISISNHAACSYSLSPASALFPIVGGTSNITLTTEGACPWAATSNVPWVTITSGASGTGNGTVSYSVGTNTTALVRSGTVTIAGQTFTVNQFGQSSLAMLIDGTATCADYGRPLAVQQIGTSFSDSTTGQVDVANGNELDAGYGIIANGVLYLTFAGNLSSDSTKLEIFFETGPGGQNTLTNINPTVDFGGLNRLGAGTNNMGLTFDTDFAANYWVGVNLNGSPITLFANYAQLWPGGGGLNGYYLGSTAGGVTNGVLFGGTNPFGIQAAVNNSNTAGVEGGSGGCFDDPSIYNQGSVMTGVELGIPLAALGSPTGAVKVCAFFSGVNHDLIANQLLGPIWDGSGLFCTNNLGDPTNGVNFATEAAFTGPHYFVVGPEMRVTGVSRSGSNINVSWLTAANSNLVYQLQSKSAITNTTWNNLGSPTNGTGVVTTQTDTGAAANSTMFYRIQQTPVCP